MVEHRAREHRAAHPADQRHPRHRADRVRHPPDGAGRDRRASTCCARRRTGDGGLRPRQRRTARDRGRRPAGSWPTRPDRPDPDQPARQRHQVLQRGRRRPARRATEHDSEVHLHGQRRRPRHPGRTSSRRSSSGSSRWTPPTPGRRAAPASASPSAAASWSGTAAGSGPRASSASAPPSSSRCPGRAAARSELGRRRRPDAPLLLVCDDDAATVDQFSAMLRRHGYRPSASPTGPRPCSRAVAEQPAALLLDLMMPGTTGAQVLAELEGAAS